MQTKRNASDDDWNIDGSRDLSDPWTGFTQVSLLEEKTSRRIYVVRGEMARGMGSPRQVSNRRRRTRKGPEPACVQHPTRTGWHTQGGKDELTSCRGTVQSVWQKPPVRRKGGRAGLPARENGRHVVRGRQSSPTPEVRLGEQARLVKTVNIQLRWAAAQPGQDRRLPSVAKHSRL